MGVPASQLVHFLLEREVVLVLLVALLRLRLEGMLVSLDEVQQVAIYPTVDSCESICAKSRSRYCWCASF